MIFFRFKIKGEITMDKDYSQDCQDYIEVEGVVIEDIEEEYSKVYDENKFIKKIKKNVKAIGEKLLYNLFIGFFLLQDPNVPVKVKATIVGALGYFIAPLDIVPDLAPGIGYADDAAAIAGALAIAAFYITPEIKEKARKKVDDLLS